MTSFESMMKELHQEYVNELPAKVKEIRKHFENQSCEILQDEFHKLKGTGRTYGVPEVSELSEIVEKICEFHPNKISEVVPPALDLLLKIHNERQKSKVFAIQEDVGFLQIQKFLNTFTAQAA